MAKEACELDVSGEETRLVPRARKQKKGSPAAPWYYLRLIGEIGFAIALPIAGGAIAGVVVDRTWGTTPKATLSLLFLGIMVSFLNVCKTVETVVKNR